MAEKSKMGPKETAQREMREQRAAKVAAAARTMKVSAKGVGKLQSVKATKGGGRGR